MKKETVMAETDLIKRLEDSDLRAAFAAHTDGAEKFTRRMAIDIADFFEVKPMSLVWQLEKRGIVKRGSYDWFKGNGGITRDHIDEARADRAALKAKEQRS